MNTEWKLVNALRDSLLWTASSLAAIGKEQDVITLEGRKRTVGEILDEANEALNVPDDAAPTSHPIPTGATGEDEQAQRDAVMDAIAEALGDAYDCTRVWSAWGVGTMSQDDFCLVTDDAGRLGELADAAIAAMTPAPAAGDALAYGSPADVAQRIEQYLYRDGRKNSATQLLYEAMKALRGPKLKGEA